MTVRWTGAGVAMVIGVLMMSRAVAQRDTSGGANTATTSPAGTAAIAGVVVLVGDTPVPMRRAIVSVSGEGLALSRDAITDDEGRFVVDGLPPGRFSVSATRAGFVPIAYGATKPGRSGSAIVLAAGQQVTGIRLELARGASIEGTVRDARGAPLTGIDILLQRRERNGSIVAAGPTIRTAAQGTQATTDDAGAYRLYGLAPGDYIVSARFMPSGSGDLSAPSEAEIDAVLSELRRRAPATRQAGAVPPSAAASGAPATPSARSVSMLPVYYPDAIAPEDATPIHLDVGDERRAVDLSLRPLSSASLDGTVVVPPGAAMAQMSLSLSIVAPSGQVVRGPSLAESPTATTGGHFRHTGVPPGKYVVTASATSLNATRFAVGLMSLEEVAAGGGMGPCYSGAAEFSTTGEDVSGVSIELHRCPSLNGRVEFVGTATPPDPAGLQIQLMKGGSSGFTRVPRVTRLAADRTFEWSSGLTIGSYYLTATVPGSGPGAGWWLRSVVMNGRDLLDTPFVLDASSEMSATAVMTFTDRHTRLGGTLRTPPGSAAVDYTVVVFPANREWWTAPFRRVQVARPDSSGAFVFHDLPAGDYLLAALTDIEPGGWQDATFLAELTGASVQVTLRDGEATAQDLAIVAR